mmetsp:Transcript_1124/g.1633  ORF Transcript_1124/g.1633 Transcript_1124/m.1633 type:complete len:241 (+) Transcript_1124:207-929(+)
MSSLGSSNDGSNPAAGLAAGGAMAMLNGMLGSVKERWDASGGNEVLSRVSSNIPQGTKDSLQNAQSKFLNPKYLRSLRVFFGIGEEKPFFFEKSPSLIMVRLQHNLSFFYLNYLLMTVILFILTLITNPLAIIGMVIIAFGWLYVARAAVDGNLQLAGVSISQKAAAIPMGIFSVILLFWLLQDVFWWAIFSSAFFALVHAFFRDASMHKDEEDKVVMMGEFSEEDAAFLNPVDSELSQV